MARGPITTIHAGSLPKKQQLNSLQQSQSIYNTQQHPVVRSHNSSLTATGSNFGPDQLKSNSVSEKGNM
jgi:hypothetical protein